ncbi:MAG: FxsA family protein [Deltaproteobacteria bacterium]|nr:FxsA family protein [Deltaproteobacteria bacterium]
MLLALFIVVPLVEVYLLFGLAQLMGFWATVALVLVTGTLGAGLAKREGLRVLGRWRSALAQGRVPEEGVLDGLLVLVGGVLLVTPGVLTDLTGLLLLLPPTRKLAAVWLRRRAERGIAAGNVQIFGFGASPFAGSPFSGFGTGPELRGRPTDAAPGSPRVGFDGVIDVDGHELPTD